MKAILPLFLALLLHQANPSSLPDDMIGNVKVDPNGTALQVLETGDFHGDEVHLTTRTGWMALIETHNHSVLRSVPIHTVREHDEVVDEDDLNAKSGRRIWIDGPKPIFLIRGLEASNPTTLGINRGGESMIGERTLSLGDRKYRLRFENPHSPVDGNSVPGPGSSLVLESGGILQTLAHFENGGDRISIFWIGDLDGDGKLDLYLDISGHYNVANKVLFLSSRAKSGKLVQAVAVLTTSGC